MDFEIRENRQRSSSKPLVREREAYFRLMDQGLRSGHREAHTEASMMMTGDVAEM